jgi:hypothetical protein
LIVEIPFVGPSYNLESRPASVQRTINLVPVPQEPGNERTAWVFKDVPGLVLMQDFAGGGSGEPGPWLGYNDGGNGPIMMDEAGAFQALVTPVPHEVGVSFANTAYNNTDGIVHVPFSGGTEEAPAFVEGVTWFPELSGAPAPTISTDDPSGGVWTGYSWVMRATHDGYVLLQGPGGELTVVTVNLEGAPFYYEGASLEYYPVPAPPASTLAEMPFTDSFSIAAEEVVWYRFVVDAEMSITMDTLGSSVDTQIGLYTSLGAFVAEDDESGGSGTSLLISPVLPAGTYYLAVCCYSSSFNFGWDVQSFSEQAGTVLVNIGETP